MEASLKGGRMKTLSVLLVLNHEKVEFKALVGVLLFLLSRFILSQYHHLFLAAMRNYTGFIDPVTP